MNTKIDSLSPSMLDNIKFGMLFKHSDVEFPIN